MNDHEINIAIAEACGWRKWDGTNAEYAKGYLYESQFPDYVNDLNAMHEAEKTFAGDDVTVEKYWLELYDATEQTRWPYDATARQRAEAFLRTLGKWKD